MENRAPRQFDYALLAVGVSLLLVPLLLVAAVSPQAALPYMRVATAVGAGLVGASVLRLLQIGIGPRGGREVAALVLTGLIFGLNLPEMLNHEMRPPLARRPATAHSALMPEHAAVPPLHAPEIATQPVEAAPPPEVSSPKASVPNCRKIGRALVGPLKAAQKAMNGRDNEKALAVLQDVGPSFSTDYEKYLVDEIRALAYARLTRYADAARVFEASLTSPCMSDPDRRKRVAILATLNYQIRNYSAATRFGAAALADDPRNKEMVTVTAQAYYLMGNNTESAHVIEHALDFGNAGSAIPPENLLVLLRSACSRIPDQSCRRSAIQLLVEHYPKPAYSEELRSLK